MNADIVSPGSGPDLRPRTSDGWGAGAAMAFGVHLILVAFLALSVRWKMSTPDAVEAEVWAEIPRAAVPEAAPPPPVTPPKVEAPPEPPKEPERAAEPEPRPDPVPDIVVARTPKKEPKKRKQHEPVEVFENEPPKVVKKPVKVDKPEKVVKVEKADKPDKTPPKEAKVVPKPEAAKPAPAKASSQDSNAKAAAEAQRQANLQRMMSDLGSLGTPSRSAGPSAAYAGRIKARIKPNIVFTDEVSGNPVAVVEVRCSPDGHIVSRKLSTPSGVASWDEAVLRAIDRTEVLPADESGKVPSVMQIEFKPKDF